MPRTSRWGITLPLNGIPLPAQRDLVAALPGLGYTDAQRNPNRDPATFPADAAYRHGFEAGRRDLQAGAYSRPEGEQRAWDRNRVVGNVE